MPKLVLVDVHQGEFDSIVENKKHYHVMPAKEVNVGDYINFNIIGELNIVKDTPKELFVVVNKETYEQCKAIKKGFAIVTLKRMVASKK